MLICIISHVVSSSSSSSSVSFKLFFFSLPEHFAIPPGARITILHSVVTGI